MEFYIDGTLISTSTAAPYVYSWNTTATPNAGHVLMVKAYDAAGNVASSSASVTVHNVSTTPTDETAPTAPGALTSTGQTSNAIALRWAASTDNVGVKSYKVYRYGATTTVFATTQTTYTDSGLAPATAYTYTVAAVDAAGNESAPSSALTVSTLAGSTPSASGLTTTVTTYDDWGGGYCANVTLKNNGTTALSNWTATFSAEGKVTSLWDAKWSQSGSTVTIKSKTYNKTIKAGATLKGIGFCASRR